MPTEESSGQSDFATQAGATSCIISINYLCILDGQQSEKPGSPTAALMENCLSSATRRFYTATATTTTTTALDLAIVAMYLATLMAPDSQSSSRLYNRCCNRHRSSSVKPPFEGTNGKLTKDILHVRDLHIACPDTNAGGG
jgi:hypothetical protein